MPKHVGLIRLTAVPGGTAFDLAEYAYYAALVYGMIGATLGLSIPLFGALLLFAIALFCTIRMGRHARFVFPAIYTIMLCGISYIVIQVLVHQESIRELNVRNFVTWLFSIIILQCLSLRKNFLRRFIIVMLAIGLFVLPFMRTLGDDGDVSRMDLSREAGISGELTNANGLAAWFGFCGLNLLILAVESKRPSVRILCGLLALGCVFVVGLTVSRGTLVALAISIMFSLRRFLKRSFVPLLSVVLLCSVGLGLGLFDRAIEFYTRRGMEESGRLSVIPYAVNTILGAPMFGIGASKVSLRVGASYITPHNGFLFLALASGCVPLLLFIIHWIRVWKAAILASRSAVREAPFCIPLCAYSILIIMFSNTVFLSPWCVAAFCIVMAAGRPLQKVIQGERLVGFTTSLARFRNLP